jgi:hypothetical protein
MARGMSRTVHVHAQIWVGRLECGSCPVSLTSGGAGLVAMPRTVAGKAHADFFSSISAQPLQGKERQVRIRKSLLSVYIEKTGGVRLQRAQGWPARAIRFSLLNAEHWLSALSHPLLG